jgi:hypothetical protein
MSAFSAVDKGLNVRKQRFRCRSDRGQQAAESAGADGSEGYLKLSTVPSAFATIAVLRLPRTVI